GGTGLMGARIADRLIARGERPVLFDVNPALWRLENIKDKVDIVRGNIVNLHEILHVIKKYKVDKVIHLAYLLGAESNADPLTATYVNSVGTINLYEAARITGQIERICIASSIAVYGFDDEYDPSLLPLKEDAPKLLAKGVLTYAAGKVYMEALGDLYRNNYGVFVCGLRPAIVYGWGRLTGATAFAGELIEKPALGQPVKIAGGNALVGLVYLDDVVDEWITLLDADKSKFKHYYFNSGADAVRVFEIAEIVKKIIPDAKIEVERGEEKSAVGLAARTSDENIGLELGFKRKFTPLEVGIEAMIKDVRSRKRP
ncbi:MAG: NAD(P)-dependent oxidoreductase, partial [Clostridia bacterium]|nr:NAD(P)-dependent oxidoreductase [Clostridia bacterium]